MHDSTYRMIAALRMRQFELLTVLADTGSMRAAGEKLCVSTAAVSKGLGEIETLLGITVFERHGRGVSLTRDGDILVHRARLLLSEVANLADDLRDRKLGHDAVLRIGAPPFIAWSLLPDVLRGMAGDAGLPPVQIVEGRLDDTQRKLESGEIDVLLTMNTSSELGGLCQEGLMIRPVGREQWIVVCAGDHPLALAPRAAPWTWRELKQQAWVLPARPTQARLMIEQLLLDHNLPPIAPAIEYMNAITNLKLVERRLGLSLLARRTVEERLARGSLVALPVEALPEPIPIVMVYRTPWHQDDIIERFHDAAHALLQAATSASADMPSGSSAASRSLRSRNDSA